MRNVARFCKLFAASSPSSATPAAAAANDVDGEDAGEIAQAAVSETQSRTVASALKQSIERSTAAAEQCSAALAKLLDRRTKTSRGTVTGGLARSLDGLLEMSRLLSYEMYSTGGSMYSYYGVHGGIGSGGSSGSGMNGLGRTQTEQIKSEIRSLKGMLISRRNFPSVAN
ncbi:hypothetical protein BC831DRAFT_484681 [Entophlyctis helioformis]|nr:hypothetical protein BC831DRAFT_484681 [Entophlyctis helioformis]